MTSSGKTKEDAGLVRAFQAGDKKAFDRLVLNHQDKVFNLCYWFLGDYQEARDAAQEAFIKAYRGLDTFRSQSAFSTWLFRITMNTCKNRVASAEYRGQKKTVSLDNPTEAEAGSPSMDVANGSASPMAALERKERMARIRTAIDALPPEHRSVIVLRDIQGLSYEEVSHITGLNLGTVKSRLSRARTDLRNRVRRDG